MNKSFSISAVIPAYNSSAFISEAVRSIRAQTAPVDEIIIVDDGSTDNTAEIVQGLGNDIVFIRQQNAGPSAARNRGIKEATSDLIAFLDADDTWVADKIQIQLDIMQHYPEVVLVAGDMAETDTAGNTLVPSVLAKHAMLEKFSALDSTPIPHALAELVHTNFIPTGTVLAHKEALQEAGGFPEDIRYGEDLALWARIAAQHAIACSPRVLMLRRQHGENVTGHSELLLQDLVKVMRLLRSECSEDLREQNINPDRLVAEAWCNLGYWYFSRQELAKARRAMHASLWEKLTLRAFFYSLISMMPTSLVYTLRRLKQYAQARRDP